MSRRDRFGLVTTWDGTTAFCRGHLDGLPVFGWREAPRGVDTVRGLRRRGLRPGGADPVALLVFGHRQPMRRREVAELYRLDLAKPKRTASPAQHEAIERALTARRTCCACPPGAAVKPYFIPTSLGCCWDCAQDEPAAA